MSAKKHESVEQTNQETKNSNATKETAIERNLFSIDLDFQPDHAVQMQIKTEVEDRQDRLHRIWAGIGRRK
jgi:hypothetical protein